MDMKEQNDQFAQNDSILSSAIDHKLDYLNQINESIKNGDDLKLYELIDAARFHQEFKEDGEVPQQHDFSLVADLNSELSHHLSNKLIDYLGDTYPFFYYHEFELGKFNIYFGNWWDHRMFGELDALNVEFHFAEDEYNKLSDSFSLEAQNQRVNDAPMQQLADENERLSQLIEQQDQRDQQKEEIRAQIRENEEKSPMPWEAAKVREEKEALNKSMLELTQVDEEAANARQTMKENEAKILSLSKDETILNLEKQNIRSSFGSFEEFNKNNSQLYTKYLSFLEDGSKVNAND
ncbi:hypothetical protein PL11_008695 [Lentilactobacillus curieae]|uniref:Exonuclease SbcC n=1 Tax=Lentilactobacillus curieae TaxID=1138822 RepID=A0A1S6QK69_9LACO|nr:hypothetical protein [Lentilactobacillus curieae]AQW21989.1 hypothetical protein PL11_008695 [Lentilactobacillus curieae]